MDVVLYYLMKKILVLKFLGIISIFFLLNGCETTSSSYEGFKSNHSNYTYFALACPASNPEYGPNCGQSASVKSQLSANQTALNTCTGSDCVIIKEGNRTVYSKEEANRVQMANLIEDSKSTCRSLGFKDGTDKFTDCALKLYSQKLDLAEKQQQQVVVQNQGSSTVRVIDVTREREDTMRRSMGLINGTCTLATYYSC